MNNDEVRGKQKQAEGRAREEVGKMTGNNSEQVKGMAKKAEGKIQEGIGKVKRKLD